LLYQYGVLDKLFGVIFGFGCFFLGFVGFDPIGIDTGVLSGIGGGFFGLGGLGGIGFGLGVVGMGTGGFGGFNGVIVAGPHLVSHQPY
jgi:hypothetical protein